MNRKDTLPDEIRALFPPIVIDELAFARLNPWRATATRQRRAIIQSSLERFDHPRMENLPEDGVDAARESRVHLAAS